MTLLLRLVGFRIGVSNLFYFACCRTLVNWVEVLLSSIRSFTWLKLCFLMACLGIVYAILF